MKISVLMTVYKRAAVLKRTIDTILQNLEPGDEIVLVDDGPYDEIDNVLKDALAETMGITFQYIRTGNKEYHNSAHAKNIGLKAAKNELILIHEAEILGFGTYIADMRKKFILQLPQFCVAGHVEIENEKGGCQHVFVDNQAPYVAVCLKKDLMAITGWDERYIYWGNEDNDLMFRLGQIKVKVGFDPEISIKHLWHDRPPAEAMGDANNSLIYDGKEKVIQVNKDKPWGILSAE